MYLYLYVTYCSSVFIVDNDKKCSVYDTVCVPYENINFSILFKNSGFLYLFAKIDFKNAKISLFAKIQMLCKKILCFTITLLLRDSNSFFLQE